MTTREENLKKINEGLEQMSDEELDQVAGGIDWDGLWKQVKNMFTPGTPTNKAAKSIVLNKVAKPISDIVIDAVKNAP